ncbi:MAG: alpha-(1-_3)-arabinofuranosyltransferase family protein [Acidimicrobiales bacterium]
MTDHHPSRRPPLGLLVLAALTYLPALTAKPGKMPTDTKLYLYLNPGRLVADAPFTWDTRQFAGWVPHQTIAYLWPSGPWFWVFDRLGVPDWVAHRLWIGTLLFLGGLGVRFAARHLGLARNAAGVAGIVYALSPYLLPYVSRTSVMLLPWMGLGWLVGLTVRAATRSRWRDVGWFGLVVLTIGAVNATALALVAPAPVLWLLHAAWQRSITWRTAIVTAIKLGAVSILVSLWWIVMLMVQGRHGADVLAFSETLEAVSLTSTSTEVLRGLGYWLFYVRDPYAFTTTAALDHLGSTRVILAGYLIVVLGLVGIATVRWSQRRFVAWMFAAGTLLAVGVHPIDDPSPLMRPLKDSALGLALRSSTRALPLSAFAVGVGAGTLVTLMSRWRRPAQWHPRLDGRTVGAITAVGLVLVALVGLPAATSGGYVDEALVRDEDVPSSWSDAVAALDDGSSEARVLQLPGSEFGAFRWGYTVDPPLPGLTDKPLVTRDLLPLGSPGAMDLLYALDNRFQNGTVDPDAIAAIARFLGVDTIWVANDLAFDRFRTPRPEIVSALFGAEPAGLGTPIAFGVPAVNVPDLAMVDEQTLADARIGTPLAPVELVPVDDPQAIVRLASRVVILAGSGDGVVDATSAGLLDGTEAVVYAADLAATPDRYAAGIPGDAVLVVTDSNRDRAYQWRGSQDVTGQTEVGGPERDALREDSSDQRLAVFATEDADQQTVARLDGGLTVSATSYGEPFALRPEDRPAMSVDGDLTTAWRVADRFDPVGEQLRVSSTDGTLHLVQQQVPTANRRITDIAVTVDGEPPVPVVLDERSLAAPGQDVTVTADRPVTITITGVAPLDGGTDSGPSAVGFAEIGPVATETVRVPSAPLDTLSADRPLALVFTRDRVRATDRWRADPERALDRTFTLPVERDLDTDGVTVTLRRDDRAPDGALDALVELAGRDAPLATSNRRLTGVAAARAASAFDGDPTTGWTTPFGQAVGSAITVTTTETSTPTLTLRQPVDGLHSPITQVAVRSVDGEQLVDVPIPGDDGVSTLTLAGPLPAGEVTITITGVDSRTTTDRRWAEQVQLPAAVLEVGGLRPVRTLPDQQPVCRTGLVQLDGADLPVAISAEQYATLADGGSVTTTPCTGTELTTLDAGSHRLTTTPGLVSGIDVDQVVFRSGLTTGDVVAGDEAPDVAPPLAVDRTRTTRTVTVDACPDGCWLVLGEGYNDAWEATVDGTSIGAPVQIAGGFDGWWLPASDAARTVEMRWTPQRGLNIALLVAILGVLASIAMVVLDRRSADTTAAPSPIEPGTSFSGTPAPRRRAVSAAVLLVVASFLVVSPSWALVAVVPAAVLVVTRRVTPAALAAAVLTGSLGLLVAWRQRDRLWFADAGWPAHFEDLHRVGLFVVALLIVGTWFADPLPDPAPDPCDQPTAADTTDPAR